MWWWPHFDTVDLDFDFFGVGIHNVVIPMEIIRSWNLNSATPQKIDIKLSIINAKSQDWNWHVNIIRSHQEPWGYIMTSQRKLWTRNVIIESNVREMKMTNWRWLFLATQPRRNRQWWSMSSRHLLHSLQCLVRSGLTSYESGKIEWDKIDD